MASTASTTGARDHARGPGRAGRRHPADRARALARPTRRPAWRAAVLWDETLGAGGYASRALPRGAHAAAGRPRRRHLRRPARCTAPTSPAERLNVADTVKVQWQAYLGAGLPAALGHGPGAGTIVEDTSGHHDTFCGTSHPRRQRRPATATAPPTAPRPRPRPLRRGAGQARARPAGPAPNVNLFTGVRVEPDGAVTLRAGRSHPGAHVLLRAELDADRHGGQRPAPRSTTGPATPPGRCGITAWRGAPAGPADPASHRHARGRQRLREHRRGDGCGRPRDERASAHVVHDEVVPRRCAVVPRLAAGDTPPHRRPPRQPGGRLPASTPPTTRPSATAPPTPSRRSGNLFLTVGTVLMTNEGRAADDDRRPTRAGATTPRRRLLVRVEHRSATGTTPSTSTPASRTSCSSGARHGLGKRDLVATSTGS